MFDAVCTYYIDIANTNLDENFENNIMQSLCEDATIHTVLLLPIALFSLVSTLEYDMQDMIFFVLVIYT